MTDTFHYRENVLFCEDVELSHIAAAAGTPCYVYSAAALREAFLTFLADPEAQVIARYAQAPIPMGGSHAWILYYASPIAH